MIVSQWSDVWNRYTSPKCDAFLEGYCAAKGITTKELASDIDHFEIATQAFDDWCKTSDNYVVDHFNFEAEKTIMSAKHHNVDFTKCIVVRLNDPGAEFRSSAVGLTQDGELVVAEVYGDIHELFMRYGQRRNHLESKHIKK